MSTPISQAAYSRHRGVSREAVRKAVRDGRIPTVGPRRLIDPELADREWVANSDAQRGGRAPAPSSSLASHQAERAAWAAKTARLEYEKKTGRLVDRAEVEARYFKRVRSVRNALFALADRLGPALAPVTDPRTVTRQLKEEFRALASQLADDDNAGG